MTHRQFLAWQAWFTLEMRRPGRLEYHVMRVAMQVAMTNAEKGQSFSLTDFGVEWREPIPAKDRVTLTDEQKLKVANAARMATLRENQ